MTDRERTAHHKLSVLIALGVRVALSGGDCEDRLAKMTDEFMEWLGHGAEPTEAQCEAAARVFAKTLCVMLEDARRGARPALEAAFKA